MPQPTVNIGRDASIKAYEVCVEMDDERHDLFKIFFFDDGHTKLRRWTHDEWAEEFTEAIVGAIKEAAPRLGV